jgi:hypothetical protein
MQGAMELDINSASKILVHTVLIHYSCLATSHDEVQLDEERVMQGTFAIVHRETTHHHRALSHPIPLEVQIATFSLTPSTMI